MKCKIPEICWHNRDPVLSVDIQKKSGAGDGPYRLASGGTDSHVLIWYINLADDDVQLNLAADLSRHQRAVNTVKWSPNCQLLASGDDESVVLIWKQKSDTEATNIMDTANEHDKEVWLALKVLRGHIEDVYDLCWSPNSLYLVSGSVDNSAIVWDVMKGKSTAILNDHKGFVQGVAWDPRNQYIATLSTDRYLRIFDIHTKRVLHRVNKGTLPVPEGHALHGRRMRYFHDDTLQTFFRRISFSPDGNLLLTPAGFTDHDDGQTSRLHATYIFSRHALRVPAIVLPSPDQYSVAVRCCPLLFSLRPHDPAVNAPVVPLPYRMIFAVATRSSVFFYDTQQHQPFAVISNIHYTRLTDVTWSSDGRLVVVSSTDGFCSLIKFEEGELGELYEGAQAVLDAVLAESELVPSSRKSKKQKENDAPTKSKQKSKGKPMLPKASKAEQSKSNVEKIKEAKATTSLTNQKRNEDSAEVAVASCSWQQPTTTNSKYLAAGSSFPFANKAVIIDKEILSSEEKFESPEKKSRPVTPISVRRHPRTPSSCHNAKETLTPISSPLSISTGAKNTSSLKKPKLAKTPQQTMRATPIPVRRKPRSLIAVQPVADKPSVVADDEAMDAWPLPLQQQQQSPPTSSSAVVGKKTPTKQAPKAEVITKRDNIVNDASMCCTEDIRLVYEGSSLDTTEHVAAAKEKATGLDVAASAVEIVPSSPKPELPQTPKQRTPRRVTLTTISTPKSKKKLLE